MKNSIINGTPKCPQTKGFEPIEGQKDATTGAEKGNCGGRKGQLWGQKEVTNDGAGVKKGNYEPSLVSHSGYGQGIIPQEWLYNPVVYSQVSGDFTLLQQRILTGILGQLQDRILHTINEKEENKRFPSLFSEKEMGEVIELDIDPSSLGITPDHYGDLEEALETLTKLTMAFPKYEKGTLNYVIAPLFSRIAMPRGSLRRRGKVRIKMLRENVEDFFSLAHGYTVHLARITQLAKKKRTPRIYIFLSSFRDIGHKEIEYPAFCQFLGIDQGTFDADCKATGRKAKENPFRKYNKVRSQILEPTKLELDTFMQRGEIDFSFEYEALYKSGQQRGNPTHIRFSIIKGALALERDEVMLRRRRTFKFTSTMCSRYRDLKQADLQALTDTLPDVMLQDFMDYAYKSVRRMIEQTQPDDVAAYTMTVLRKWIGEHLPEYRHKQQLLTWQHCQQDLLSQTTNETSRQLVSNIRFESFDEDKRQLTLRLPDKDTYAFLEQPAVVSGVLQPTLERHYNYGVRLAYRIISDG